MRKTLPVSMRTRASRTGSAKGLFRLVASRRGRSPIRSPEKLDPSRAAFSMMFDSFVLAFRLVTMWQPLASSFAHQP
jgi:hypothetical protein